MCQLFPLLLVSCFVIATGASKSSGASRTHGASRSSKTKTPLATLVSGPLGLSDAEKCPEGFFYCDKSKCIEATSLCDEVADCEDKTDEKNTLCLVKTKCTADTFMCSDSSMCIPKENKCDGQVQCLDGSDEISCGIYRTDYQYDDSIDGWFKYHYMPEIWRRALFRCRHEGSVLASPLNDQLLEKLKTFINDSGPVFTGIAAAYSPGYFFSVEGVSFDQINKTWAPSEPNNWKNKERCIGMYSNGSLADLNCDLPLPYICFRSGPLIGEANECGTRDPEYILEPETGHCYKLHRRGMIWEKAFAACVAEGGHLAIINSKKEASVLKNLIKNSNDEDSPMMGRYLLAFLIGFRDWGYRSNGTEWMTIDGRTLEEAGYEQWDDKQPNNRGRGQHCGAINTNGKLNDFYCEETTPFICEKPPGSLIVKPPKKSMPKNEVIEKRKRKLNKHWQYSW